MANKLTPPKSTSKKKEIKHFAENNFQPTLEA